MPTTLPSKRPFFHFGVRAKNATAGKDFGATATALSVAEQEPIDKFNIVGYFPATKQIINLVYGRGKGIPKTSAV